MYSPVRLELTISAILLYYTLLINQTSPYTAIPRNNNTSPNGPFHSNEIPESVFLIFGNIHDLSLSDLAVGGQMSVSDFLVPVKENLEFFFHPREHVLWIDGR